jgi:hypothetical protein
MSVATAVRAWSPNANLVGYGAPDPGEFLMSWSRRTSARVVKGSPVSGNNSQPRKGGTPEERTIMSDIPVSAIKAVFLRDIGGIEPLCGFDAKSRYWCELWMDERESVQCSQCGRRIHNGWVCLRTGQYRCHEHVSY